MRQFTPQPDRYDTIVSMLREILQRIAALERAVDQVDRDLRPYGDGSQRKRA